MNIDNSHLRILIVEDTLKNIQVLGTILRNENYQINVAQNGVQALEVVQKILPDLILLDIMMPEMDGFETCERLKADPATKEIPVIFLTAKTEVDDIVKGFDLGAVDYVTKPFNSAELLARVRTHLFIHLLQAALKSSYDDIARMNREQEAFLRYELDNKISPILGYADMLVQFDMGNLEDNQREWVTKIQAGAGAMSTLMDAIKQLQDFESGRATLTRAPVDLETVVKNVIFEQETVYGAIVRIDQDGSLDGVTIEADEVMVKNTFQNLIKYAMDHVVEHPDDAQRVVEVAFASGDGQATVGIRHKGDPIPPDQLETFFEKFSTSKEGKGGTGLETAYAYLVTRAHGGEISVASDATDGTSIIVRLPQG